MTTRKLLINGDSSLRKKPRGSFWRLWLLSKVEFLRLSSIFMMDDIEPLEWWPHFSLLYKTAYHYKLQHGNSVTWTAKQQGHINSVVYILFTCDRVWGTFHFCHLYSLVSKYVHSYRVLFNDCIFSFVYLKGLISLKWNIILGKIFI